MHLEDADHWVRKAAEARDLAAKMSGEHAQSIMLEIAEYYEQCVRETRTTTAMLASTDD